MRAIQVSAAKLAALFFLLVSPLSAGAQDITLTSRDGNFTLDGTMISFDGEFYRLDTIYGPLTVDGMGVTCEGPGCPDLEAYVAEVMISGSEAMGEVLIPALLEAFAAQRGLRAAREIRDERGFTYSITDPDGRILARMQFNLSTTDEGFADLFTGEADIALAVREVRTDEVGLGREAEIGVLSSPEQSRIIAFDAFVVAVAPDNPLRWVSPEAIARVLAGEITEWGPLGGREGERIRLHMLADALGSQQAIEATLLKPYDLAIAPNATRHIDEADLADAVARDIYAVGVTLKSAIGPARALALGGSCGFMIEPDDAAIRSEDYPLVAPLFLYTPKRRLPAVARDFLAFMSSSAAVRVMGRAGFTDLGARHIPLSEQGERLAKAIQAAGNETSLATLQTMVSSLAGAERLSPTFRFRPGAAGLDAPSRGNATLLAEALEAGLYNGRELIFVGFSDGEGSADVNLRLARNRAAVVRDAVKALAESADFTRVRLRTEAFGEALPMACDDSEWGRRVNRRVEVWLR